MLDNIFREETKDKKVDIEEEVMKYQNRFNNSLAKDTHTPSTYLIEDDLRDKLDSLLHQLNIENGVLDNKSKSFKLKRKMLKGFKFKFINAAIKHYLDEFEKGEGEIKHVDCITYKVNEYINNKMYVVENSKDGYTLIYHGHDAVEIGREDNVSYEYVLSKIDEVSDKRVRIGRKKKSSI